MFSGNFRAGEQGTILKKLCPKEQKCLEALMTDVLRPYVPEFKGQVERDDESILLCESNRVKDRVKSSFSFSP